MDCKVYYCKQFESYNVCLCEIFRPISLFSILDNTIFTCTIKRSVIGYKN